jgi:rhodanese-related sulfurtransferase
MKALFLMICRALAITLAFSSIGMFANLASDTPIPWVYSPPKEITVAGVKVQLIDEREAVKFLNDPETVFIDSRKCDDYAKSHVKGAICLPPDDIEQRFPSIEALMPTEGRFILYCYGPECDMAERVSEFLAQMGHKNLMIMSSGFPAWLKARFPVDGKGKEDAAIGDPEDFWREEEIADSDTEIVLRRFCRCIDRSPLPVNGILCNMRDAFQTLG